MTKPNILLIVMDTARADYVEKAQVMPHLHDFAGECTWFSNVFANAPWTLPSHSSIFTGQYPSTHGVTGAQKSFTPESNLMTELGDAGYDIVAFSNNPWISPDFGFDDFDEFVPCWKPFVRGADLAEISQKEGTWQQIRAIAAQMTGLNAPFTVANALYMKFIEGIYDSGAALTNHRFKQWFADRRTNQPFFAFINYMEPHLRYNPPRKHRELFLDDDEIERWNEVNQDPWAYLTGTEPMDEADFEVLKKLYCAELHYLDARLYRLFEYLEERRELESTVVIVTGDHGENIGDHDLMDHQYSLHDSLLRVPLLIRFPQQFEQGKRDDRLFELRDLFTTILSLAGSSTSGSDASVNPPLDLTNGEVDRDAVISEYLSPQPSIGTLCTRYGVPRDQISKYDRALRSIRSLDRKMIQGSDGTKRYFSVSQDSTEEPRPLDETGEELVAQLRDVLGKFDRADKTGDRKLSSANKQRLEDLGYL